MKSLWTNLNAEPTVDEILDDPIVRLLMRGDGTEANEVRRLIEMVRVALGADHGDSEPAAAPPSAAPAIDPAAEAA